MDPTAMNPPLRILSLDGGGIRGLSSLLILENVMEQLRQVEGLDKAPKPCDYFDLIGGTSTGGIIAIMLGRMGMTVDECIRAYKEVAKQAFTPKRKLLPASPSGAFSATQLEVAIKQMVRKHCTHPTCVEERDQGTSTTKTCPHDGAHFRHGSCTKTVVLAITKDNVDALPTLFKTYDTSASLDGCTVWQVARATSAATTFFKPIRIGRDEVEYVDAGFGYNNPCKVLIDEAQTQFPDRKRMLVLSIGTGLGDVVKIGDTRMSILTALKKMATTSKKVALQLKREFGDDGVYYRFNVDQGLQDVTLSDWEKSSNISAHTTNYLNENEEAIKQFVNTFIQQVCMEPVSKVVEDAGQAERRTVYWIPFSENTRFVQRTTTLEVLKQKLFAPKSDQNVALVGLGGMGKTQVALHLAHWVKVNKPHYSVFWLPAFSLAGFEQECQKLVEELGIQRTKEEDAKEAMKQHLGSKKAGNWFLIVDNADDMEILYGSTSAATHPAGGIYDFLPCNQNGRILFTTRSQEVAVAAASNAVVRISQMHPGEAIHLLKELTDDELYDDAEAAELVEALTYLPLAIAQAAAYMNINRVYVAQYLGLFESTDKDTIELLQKGFRDRTLYDRSQGAVATTWIVSFERIHRSFPAAANLLLFVAFIEPKAIPRSILPELETEQQMTEAIGTLVGHGFLSQRGRYPVFDMHSLVHLATRIWHEGNDRGKNTRQMTLAHLAEVFPPAEWENLNICRQYFPHALRVLEAADSSESEESCELGFCLGQYLLIDGRAKEAVKLLEHVVAIEEQALAEDHLHRLASQHELARAYLNDAQIKEAVRLLENVVAIQEQALAEDHPYQLTSQHMLAGAYLSDGQIKEAVRLLEHVVAIQEVLAEDHPDRLASQHELAGAYLSDGQIKEAVRLLEYVVAIEKKILGEDDPNRLVSQRLLARAYQAKRAE